MEIYNQIIINRIQCEVKYKFDLIFRLLLGFIPTIIIVLVWNAVYKSNPGLSYEFFNSYQDMLKYIIFSNILFNVIEINNYAMSNDIRNGELNKYLLRPVNYIRYKIFSDLGGFLVNLTLILIPLLIITFILKIHLLKIIMFILMAILSFCIKFYLMSILSFLTFWFTDVSCLFATVSFITSFLSGTLIPISAMPNFIKLISNFLPFRFLGYETAVYMIANKSGYLVILQQMIWIAFLWVISKILWNRGLKVYGAFSG